MEQHAPGPEPSAVELEAWEKLRRLAEKHRASDDPDISKALEAALVAEAQSLALSATSKPAWLKDFPLVAGFFLHLSDSSDQSDKSDKSGEPAESTTILSEEPVSNDVDEAERLIRDAHIASMRGDKARQKELLTQAEKAAPTAPPVLAALGDEALARHNVKEAIRLYEMAMKADPRSVVYERKHAEAVFRQAQGTIFDPLARSDSLTDAASAKAGVVLSFMLPGLGQIVTGETVKGVVILGCWLGAWITAFFIGFDGLWAMLGMKAVKDASATVLLPLAVAVVFHLGAIFDASAKAKRWDKPVKIDRPRPPEEGGNRPFE